MANDFQRTHIIGIDPGIGLCSLTYIKAKENFRNTAMDDRERKWIILARCHWKPDREPKTMAERIFKRAVQYYEAVSELSQTAFVALETPILPHGSKLNPKIYANSMGLYWTTWYILHNYGYTVIPVNPLQAKQETGYNKGHAKKKAMITRYLELFHRLPGHHPQRGNMAQAYRETYADSFFIAAAGLRMLMDMKNRRSTWPRNPLWRPSIAYARPGKHLKIKQALASYGIKIGAKNE